MDGPEPSTEYDGYPSYREPGETVNKINASYLRSTI